MPQLHPAAAILAAEPDKLLACVHCGFCLSACPTYTRLGDEADSPRGRIVLMRAVAEGRLAPDDPAFGTHIDRCLGCRACEPVCPSGVQYGYLLELAREANARAAGRHWMTRALLALFGNTTWSRAAGLPGRALRAGGLAGWLVRHAPRRLPRLRFALAMLASTRAWPELSRIGRDPHGGAAPVGPATATAGTRPAAAAAREPATEDVTASGHRGVADPHGLAAAIQRGTSLGPVEPPGTIEPRRTRVALLDGCVQQSLFARVNAATRSVLEANGCEIVDVPAQGCCGALHAHGGDLGQAKALARKNVAAFHEADVDFIVVNAAGCGAMMKEYGEQLHGESAFGDRAAAVSARVRDVSEFLVAAALEPGAPLPVTVAYDAPCHLHHAQRITRAPIDVLAAIPGLKVVPIRGHDECCGGAGIYGLLHAELGGRILADKVEAMREAGADVVATPNPGCAMQLGAGLILAGDRTPVVHPIELLAESYRRRVRPDPRGP
jgi:glycolate oxidase iron-sulfur subunit